MRGGGMRGGRAAAARVATCGRGPHGRSVQVDPMKPLLKAPGSMLLKLMYCEPLSTFAFKICLRRYITERL